MRIKDIGSISYDYEKGDYSLNLADYHTERLPTGYIFDLDKTVRWNMERLEEHNRNVESEKKRLNADRNSLDKQFRCDCITALMNDFELTHSQSIVVYEYCYAKYHHNMTIFFEELESLGKFTKDIIKA